MQDNTLENLDTNLKSDLSISEQAKELQQLYDQAPCGYHSLDKDGVFIRINQTELTMLGYSREEIIGKKKFSDLLTPQSQKTFQANFPIFKQRGWVQDLEFDIIRKDGTILPVSISATAIRDKDGNYLMSRSVVLDISERKQIQSALLESQHFIQRIAQTVPYLLTVYDLREHRNIYSNRSVGEMLGYSTAEIEQMGDRLFELLKHPDEPDYIAESSQQADTLQNGEVREFEHRLRHSNGEWHWYNVRYTAFSRNPEGKVTQILSSIQDISDRKIAETQLNLAKERLRHLMSANPAVLYACQAKGDYAATFITENVSTMLGYESRDFLADSQFWASHIHPEDAPQVFSSLSHLFERNWYIHEYRFQHQDGSYRWVRDELKLIRNAEGEPLEIVGYWIDITQSKQYEQKIREQADLLDIAPDAIFVHDLDYRIVFWNQGAARLYGWQTGEAIGKNSQELVTEDSLPQLEEAFQIVLEEGIWQGELQKVTQTGGKIVTVMSRRSLMRDEAGQPKSILTVDTDITEKKQLESQFLRAQRLESLGILASGIAHDLNNILTPILGIVQLLPVKLPNLDEQTKRLLNILNDSTRRGAELVKQILSFTRGMEGNPTTIQVIHVLSEIRTVVRQTFPKNIELSINIDKNLWLVLADVTQLHQVFMNLCVNARDAMLDGGKLEITAENLAIDESYARMNLDAQVGSYVVITIADTGMGIPAKILDRIFDPFFTTKEIGKGTGLGLFTVMGIIKSHGGFLNVYSEVGRGTRFKVYLPATEDTEIESVEDFTPLIGHGELILVVDDEVSVQEITRATLEAHNYKAMIASDGIEAIALYAENKHKIDVILLDLMMPSLDSVTIIRTLHKLNPQAQIIAMSGLATNESITKTMNTGIQGFLAKPFTARDLLNSLSKVCFKNQ